MNKKILIIEDEAPLIQALAEALSTKFDVVQATNGRVGLEKALSENPDFVLLDMMLPEMVGIEVLSRIRQDVRGKNIPVIILTNLTDLNLEMKARELGVEDYLVKANVSINTLTKNISKILKV